LLNLWLRRNDTCVPFRNETIAKHVVLNLKNLIKILILTFILNSCKKETPNRTLLTKSNFELKTDITNFKDKMSELDTIKFFMNHSVCSYFGFEKITITKKIDSIKVISEFNELTFDEKYDPDWNLVFEKTISKTDSIWKFEKFISRNFKHINSDVSKHPILIIKNEKDTIIFYTDGLRELNDFIADYYLTMRKLHPENKNGIYGIEIE